MNYDVSPIYVSREDLEEIQQYKTQILPRRYQVPNGYLSPSRLTDDLTSNVWWFIKRSKTGKLDLDTPLSPGDNITLSTIYSVGQLQKSGSPVYFVGKELLESIDHADLPDSFKIDAIPWPADGFLLMLPSNYFKVGRFSVNYLLITAHPAGNGYKSFIRVTSLPTTDEFERMRKSNPLYSGGHCIISQIERDSIFAEFKEKSASSGTQEEESREIADRAVELALKLVLLMSARPQYVETFQNRVARPEKRKGGKVILEALWTPNFIGRNYERVRERVAHQGGTVRAHIRRGHWRMQPHGPRDNPDYRLILIDSVWVGLE